MPRGRVSAVRSRNMASIGSKNTEPEILVRRALHAEGFRFRLHRRDLPGKPDIVLPKYRTVVFVNGCFWHRRLCASFAWPARRAGFWRGKLLANARRDADHAKKLRSLGWNVVTVWECELRLPAWKRRVMKSLLPHCKRSHAS